jgi:hypothetical protein
MRPTEVLAGLVVVADKAREDLCDSILALPQNPEWKDLGDHCGVVRSSMLEGSWTSGFHDWRSQHGWVVAALKRCDVSVVVDRLRGIVQMGRLVLQERSQKLHPGVIRQLKEILDGSNS